MSKFKIIHQSSNKVFVFINVYCYTNEFWTDLEDEINLLKLDNINVYFDFVVQTGKHNRFLKTVFHNNHLVDGLTIVDESAFSDAHIFNEYLMKNIEIITNSLLSTREKDTLLEYLFTH